MIAEDGSRHSAEMLLAEALDGVARSAAKAPVSEVAVAVPAHWRPSAVEALRGALGGKPGLARSPLVSDAEAALTALRSNPGLPMAGVIVLCDFGGSGTSITVVDAAANDAPIGETVRVPDFSGDQIDQAILTNVVAGIFDASDADPAGTSMVGSLSALRDECRRAKERLSDETATAIVIDVPGMETTVRMTRMELDHLIDEPLAEFLAALADTLGPQSGSVGEHLGGCDDRRRGTHPADHTAALRAPPRDRRHHTAAAADGRRGRRADRPPEPGRRDRDRDGPCRCRPPPPSPRPQSAVAPRPPSAVRWRGRRSTTIRMTPCTPSRTSTINPSRHRPTSRPEVHFRHEECGRAAPVASTQSCRVVRHWPGRPSLSPRWCSASPRSRGTPTPFPQARRRASPPPHPSRSHRRLPPSLRPRLRRPW